MESVLNNNRINLQSSAQKNVSDLVNSIKTKQEIRRFCQSFAKLIEIKIKGLYLKDFRSFDIDIVLQYKNKSKC